MNYAKHLLGFTAVLLMVTLAACGNVPATTMMTAHAQTGNFRFT